MGGDQDFEVLSLSEQAISNGQEGEAEEGRRIWDREEQIWYYSITDFVKYLTQSKNPKVYWSAIKKRDQGLGETLKKIKVFPMRAKDGRLRDTECATREMMLRIIQSIPSTLRDK